LLPGSAVRPLPRAVYSTRARADTSRRHGFERRVVGREDCPIQGRREACRCWDGPLPPSVTPMTDEIAEPPAMREGDCPYCERNVLVYEQPPRCPLCACPLDERTMHPYVFPGDRAPSDPE
jgi:hypothetical protein